MGRRVGRCVVAGALRIGILLSVARAWAEESNGSETEPALLAERGQGAEECPDADALAGRVREIRGKPDLGALTYHVRFTHEDSRFKVRIETASGNARELESRDAACGALGNAAAVTIALLVDSEAPIPSTPAPVPPQPTLAADHHEVFARRHVRKSRAVDGTLGASFMALTGVLGRTAFAGTGELGIAVQRFRVAIGAVWAPRTSFALGPGHVDETLVGGVTRICFAPLLRAPFRLDACSGAFMGDLTAESHGYSRDDRHGRPYVAIPAELAVSVWTRHVGVELGALALVPVHRSDFAIDGLGVAYRSPVVGAAASLRVIGVVPLGAP